MSVRLCLAALAILAAAQCAQAADLPGPFPVNAPIQADNPCADRDVLNAIQRRFAWAERTNWRRGFVMQSLLNPRSSNHLYAEPGLIRREYCMADSRMTDESDRTVYFAIEFGQGLASIGNYVDFCVLGLDPWHVHDDACRTVR